MSFSQKRTVVLCMTALCLIARCCHRLLRFTSVSWAQVLPNQLAGATPCPGCVEPVGELSDASTQAPAPSSTHAHTSTQAGSGERLLKDSDSRNNNKEGYKQNRRCSPRLSQRAACMTSGYVAPTCELAPSLLGQCAAPTLPGPKTLNWAWAQGLLVGGGALNASSPLGTLLVLLPHLLCPTADQHDLGQLYTAP